MPTEPEMLDALASLANEQTLRLAINSLQMYHAPKHLIVEHVRAPNNGYGSSFFMKRKVIKIPGTPKMVWGKPVPTTVAVNSTAFGDLEAIDRNDEFKIISHMNHCDSCGIADGMDLAHPNRFFFFTDVPEPYVGFDFLINQSLPIEAGYLCIVIAVAQPVAVITAFPCTRAFYISKNAHVLHR